MNKDFKVIGKDVYKTMKDEKDIKGRMTKMDKHLGKLDKDEEALKKKEHEIEDKENFLLHQEHEHSMKLDDIKKHENWGEGNGEHHIHQVALRPI